MSFTAAGLLMRTDARAGVGGPAHAHCASTTTARRSLITGPGRPHPKRPLAAIKHDDCAAAASCWRLDAFACRSFSQQHVPTELREARQFLPRFGRVAELSPRAADRFSRR